MVLTDMDESYDNLRFRCPEVVSLEDLVNERMDGIEKCAELARAALERQVVTTAEALEKSHQQAAAAAERNTQFASEVLERRLDMLNEFRTAMKDQAAGFFTRAEHSLYMESVASDLRSLREWRSELKGMASQSSVNVALLISLLSLFIGSVSILLRMVGK
jgi:hypothetical protein